jgi:hypothetical protein
MNQSFIEEVPDVVIVETVERILSFSPHLNEPQVSQDPELV